MSAINAHLYKSMYIIGLENLLLNGLPIVPIYRQYVLYTTQTNGLKDNNETYSTCRDQLAFDIRISDSKTKECYGFIALKQSRISDDILKVKDMERSEKARYILSADRRSVAGNPYLIDDHYGSLIIEDDLIKRMADEEKEVRKELEEIKKMVLVKN